MAAAGRRRGDNFTIFRRPAVTRPRLVLCMTALRNGRPIPFQPHEQRETIMSTARLNPYTAAPKAVKAMLA